MDYFQLLGLICESPLYSGFHTNSSMIFFAEFEPVNIFQLTLVLGMLSTKKESKKALKTSVLK